MEKQTDSKNIQIPAMLFDDIVDFFGGLDDAFLSLSESVLYDKILSGLFDKLERLSLRNHYSIMVNESDIAIKNQARLHYLRLKNSRIT